MSWGDGSWEPRCRAPRGLVLPVRVDPTGHAGPTRGQSRGPDWRKTSYGYFVPAHVSGDPPEQRALEQSVRLPRGGAVTGWASCRLWGAAFFDGLPRDGVTRLPVPLVIGPEKSIREDSAIVVSREGVDGSEVVTAHGMPHTTPTRALFDAMRWADDDREAAVALDMMAAAEVTSISRMTAYVETRAGAKGVSQVRRALTLANEHSLSPNEARMRFVWELDAGLPRPLVNQPVFELSSGRLLGIADLLDPVAGVVGEFDGAAHRRARRHRRDVMREDRMRRAGLEYFKVVGADLGEPDMVADRMLATRARARFLAPADRAWTLQPPRDWYSSPEELMTLDERLAYRAELHGSTP